MAAALDVLALITDGFGGRGGIARYNRDLLSALSTSDTVKRVLALPRYAPLPPEPVPPKVTQAPAIAARAGYMAAALRSTERRGPFNGIFCGHLYMAPFAALLAARLGAPLWLQVHGIEAWSPPGALIRKAVMRARMVTSVSRYTRRRFLAWADLAPETVRVLPNTFDPVFTRGERPVGLARRLDVEDRKVLLTVSRLDQRERYKGIDRVLAALPRVRARHQNLAYVVVGDGTDRERLSREAGALGLADCVRFVGDVPAAELADYYRLADVFVMPSTGEGFGIVFLEAAAAGLPVIGGNRDGSVDALADGVIGRAIDSDNLDALATAIVASLSGGPASNEIHRFRTSAFRNHVSELLSGLRAVG